MLIATIALLTILFGENSLESYLVNIEKPVQAAVESKVTVEEVLAVSKELNKQLKAQNKKFTDLRKNFLDLHVSHDPNQADIEVIIDKIMTASEEGQTNILDARSAMKELMTKKEWTEVFSRKDA